MIHIPGLDGLDKLPRALGADNTLILDKGRIFDFLVADMYSRTRKMFKYENVPDTFDVVCFERALQSQGFCIVKKITSEMMQMLKPDINGNEPPEGRKYPEGIYPLLGIGQGGYMDPYYRPLYAIGNNPYLGVTIYDLIGEDCVNVWNDSMQIGLSKINSFYGGLLADAYMTLRLMMVLHRAPSFIEATTEDEKADAIQYLADLDAGKLGVIGSSVSLQRLLGGNTLETHRMTGDSHNNLKDCLEAIQYLKGQWMIALGLNDNYNMKRESLNSSETEANFDTLFPKVDDMLKCREKGVEQINKMYGLNIRVSLDGAWARLAKREEQSEEAKEAEIEAMQASAEQPEDPKPEEGETEDGKDGD